MQHWFKLPAHAFFLDVVNDVVEKDWADPPYEAIGAFGLILGITASAWAARILQLRNQKVEQELDIAQGEFKVVVERLFKAWALTPAERDVALLSIKGFPIDEIAKLRVTSKGTIKAQLTSIYRKSGASGRTALVSQLFDELLNGL